MIRTNQQGEQRAEVYCALTMSFAFEGQTIFNPLRTPDDSADCSPEFYGFTLWPTGGGCEAHGLKLPSGHYLLLTDADGYPVDLESPEDRKNAVLGRYDAEGNEMAMVMHFSQLPRNGSAQ